MDFTSYVPLLSFKCQYNNNNSTGGHQIYVSSKELRSKDTQTVGKNIKTCCCSLMKITRPPQKSPKASFKPQEKMH